MPGLSLETVAVPLRHVTMSSDHLGVDPKQVFRPPPPIMEQDQSHGTTQERRTWLKRWCLEHPQETIRAAQKAVTEHFSRGLGNAAVIEIMNEARVELDGGRQPERPPEVSDGIVKLLAALVAGKVEFSVGYSPDGQPSVTPKP